MEAVAQRRLALVEQYFQFGEIIDFRHVLRLVVREALYHRFPEAAEGELTRIKSIVVSRATCAMMASRVHLEEFVLVGKGLDHDGHIPSSILAGTFEGLIAGIYLDGGLEAARTFLMPLLDPEIESSAATLHMQNFKSLLQHIAQKKLGSTPNYRVLDERGPDHSKVFHISAVVAGRVFPAAWGSNKRKLNSRSRATNPIAIEPHRQSQQQSLATKRRCLPSELEKQRLSLIAGCELTKPLRRLVRRYGCG